MDLDILYGIGTIYNKMNINNILIIGGGTAGWLTALYIKKHFSSCSITLIEGETVGTIGVGEGTTPHIIDFLKEIDIDIFNLIKNTNGTIKNGISFENWNGDNKKYFHSFPVNNQLNNFNISTLGNLTGYEYYLKKLINKKLNFNEYVYPAKLSYENKIDLSNITFALHFDTNALSNYLRDIAKERGIKIINGDFKNVIVDKNNFITSVVLTTGIKLDCNFIFDCSGFSKLLIGKYYKEEWISYKEHLPVNKAVMFPRAYKEKEEIFPYTKAIALKNGWVFEIPLQHRIGRGYIFNDTYANEEQIINELSSTFNENIDIKKIIKFDAGRFRNSWVKNCMAVGLSHSFIEPLEATSIFFTIRQLRTFSKFFNHMFKENKDSIKLFNKLIGDSLDNILNFIYLHYVTKRKDSEFWLNFKNYTIPNNFEYLLNLIKNNNLRTFDIPNNDKIHVAGFNLESFLEISNGLNIFEKEIEIDCYENVKPDIEEYKQIIDFNVQKAYNHKEFLKNII